jgi:hypothetical protein
MQKICTNFIIFANENDKRNNMNNKEPDYVYIVTNPNFREDWVKIANISRPVDVRSYTHHYSFHNTKK